MDGVFEASEEFGVRWVAQCGGQLLDGCGVVVLLVSIRVRRVLGHPLGGLCGRGYRGQVLQVAVVWGVQSHAFEPWGVVGVLVFGLRCELLRCAASCELRAAAPRCSGLVALSGTRGLGNPAAVKRFSRVPVGGRPRDAAVTRTGEQAGKALRSQGHQYARVM